MYICHQNNNDIINYTNKINEIESKFKIINECDINELKIFYKKFSQYIFIFKILYENNDFYEDLKFIETSNDYEQLIWINEHYNFLNEIRSIESTIKLMIKDSIKIGFITKIQYELLKKIEPKIKNVFKMDVVLSSIFENEKKNIELPIIKEYEFYFDIIEIIIYKMYEYQKEKLDYDVNSNDINYLLRNDKYINLISNIKNVLKNNNLNNDFIKN